MASSAISTGSDGGGTSILTSAPWISARSTPASVASRRGDEATPVSTANRAAQRDPLPQNSLRPPSEL